MSIKPFSFDAKATDSQRNAITPALEEMSEVFGDRLKSITLVPKTKTQMPDWDSSTPGVQPAWGLWKGWNRKTERREIWYYDEVWRSKDCVGLIQHEGFHAYDDLYMSLEMKSAVMELMVPEPVSWTQGKTWSKFPFECAAVFGSAALFDMLKPPYVSLLDRKIPKTKWAELKAILLATA